MSLRTFAASAAAFATRYPKAGAIDTTPVALQASADDEKIDVQAAAFRGYAPGDKLVFVKATALFYVAGEPTSIGEVIEVTASEARYLKSTTKARIATDEEVAAAKKSK